MAYSAPGLKNRRLQSWKEIAAYLGRDVRTVIRWEKERGLPVRRDNSGPGRPTVYADSAELERWLLGDPDEVQPQPSILTEPPPRDIEPDPSNRRMYLFALIPLLLIVALGVSLIVSRIVARGSE